MARLIGSIGGGAWRAESAAITTLREEGATRLLSVDDVGRLFALGFAFDQLRDHLIDLMNRTAESAKQS